MADTNDQIRTLIFRAQENIKKRNFSEGSSKQNLNQSPVSVQNSTTHVTIDFDTVLYQTLFK